MISFEKRSLREKRWKTTVYASASQATVAEYFFRYILCLILVNHKPPGPSSVSLSLSLFLSLSLSQPPLPVDSAALTHQADNSVFSITLPYMVCSVLLGQ